MEKIEITEEHFLNLHIEIANLKRQLAEAQKLREQLEELQKQVKDLEHAAASNAEAEQEPAAKK